VLASCLDDPRVTLPSADKAEPQWSSGVPEIYLYNFCNDGVSLAGLALRVRPILEADTLASLAKSAAFRPFFCKNVWTASRLRCASTVTGLEGRPDKGYVT